MNIMTATAAQRFYGPAASAKRIVVGIGELAVSSNPEQSIVTHALGSCIAVCLFDPVAHVAAMLHFLLPDAKINAERARVQPGAFADTGIPLLFQTAYTLGLDKKRTIVTLAGGAELGERASAPLQIGRRNALAAKNLLWRNGVLVKREEIGGNTVRTVYFSVQDGRVQIVDGCGAMKEL